MLTALRRLCGQLSGGPRGEVDQSCPRSRTPISPPPVRKSAALDLRNGLLTAPRARFPASATSGLHQRTTDHYPAHKLYPRPASGCGTQTCKRSLGSDAPRSSRQAGAYSNLCERPCHLWNLGSSRRFGFLIALYVGEWLQPPKGGIVQYHTALADPRGVRL
jgi:hypothetical protein